MRVIGILKWFSESKGYGFIAVEGLGDVLVHRLLLRAIGITAIKEGTTIECEAIQKEKGWQAHEIYSVDESTAKDLPPQDPSPPGRARPPTPREEIQEDEPEAKVVAKVKWFSRPKGYGFLTVSGRNEDVFIHTDILRRFGLRDLTLGQRLLVRMGRGPKGLTVVEVHNLVEDTSDAEPSPVQGRSSQEPQTRDGVLGELLFINEARGHGIVVLPEIKDVAYVPLELLQAAGITSADEHGMLICDIEFAPTIIVVRRLTRLN